MPGKTLANKAPSAAVALAERIEDLRQGGFLAEVQGSEDTMDRMVNDILGAETAEELDQGTTPIAQLEGATIGITGVNFLPSNVRETDFAVIRYVDTGGKESVTTNGGLRLVATLVKAVELGLIGPKKPWARKVASADVEYQPGQHGRTYFLVKP